MTKLAILLAGFMAAPASASPPIQPDYKIEQPIAGPDGGGWDYARIDSATRRLYIARSSSITVVDIASGQAVGSIGHLTHGHAVMPLSGGRLLATSGDDATTLFLQADDGKELARIAVGKKPDAAILSVDGRRAFVMNADSGTISVIDTATMKPGKTITVKPALEYAAITASGMLFINNEDANEMEVVDVDRGSAGKAIPLTGCEAPSGLGYDAKTGRLIAACANGKAAIVDATHRRLIGLVDIGRGPDAVIVDATRRLAFIPCGKDGVLDMLALDGPAIARVGQIKTEMGARTGALDPETGAIYLPTARFAPPEKPGARPKPVAGSFHILVIRPAR